MRGYFLLLLAAPLSCVLISNEAGAQATTTPAVSSGSNSDALTEIVVTAEKRGAETLLTTPVPVAVLDTSELAKREQVMLQDYATEVPGFNVSPSTANESSLSIRGINTGGQGGGPTVGITLDDVPFAALTYLPDLDPGDLSRIEVLRGPQGTLYGANSMGGLVRFVTIAPSTTAFSGQLSAGTGNIVNGDGNGLNLRGSVNVPITDTLAVRVSAFRRDDPGYIYDSLTNTPGVNKSTAEGGRAAALWRPNDNFSVQLSALSQTIHNAASDELIPALGELTTGSPKNSTSSTVTVQNYSGVINADIGGFHLTSLTGYNLLTNDSAADFSFAFGHFIGSIFGVAPYADVLTPDHSTSFSQELRVNTTFWQHLDVQVAGFFTHGTNSLTLTIAPPNPFTGQLVLPPTAFNTFTAITDNKEYAGFTDLTYHFTDQFQVQVGGRISHLEVSTDPYNRYGVFNGPTAPVPVPATNESANPFTFLVTPSFQLTPDLLIYARAASGYRQGGTNTTPGVPAQYAPDKTYNYEVGSKGKFWDGRITTDLSVYYIDWKEIQLQLRTPRLLVYTGNGGSAKSEGVEYTMAVKPLKMTTISGWIDYDNAVLTSDFVNSTTYGMSGDRLPNTAKFSGHLALQQDVTLPYGATGFAEVDANYVGSRVSIFQPTALRQDFPSYVQTNMSAGVNYKDSSVDVYVNNVADQRGILNGGLGYANPAEFVYIRPRSIGVSFTQKW